MKTKLILISSMLMAIILYGYDDLISWFLSQPISNRVGIIEATISLLFCGLLVFIWINEHSKPYEEEPEEQPQKPSYIKAGDCLKPKPGAKK